MSALLKQLPLGFAALAGPLAWSAHDLLSASLVSGACRVGSWPLNLLTVVCAAVALLGLAVGARSLGSEERRGRRFVVGTSVLVDAFFAVAVVFEGVPSLVLNPCWS